MGKKKTSPAAGPSTGSGQSPPSPSSSTASHPPSGANAASDETDPKKVARRERNRLAASAFRNRKKERLEGLEGRLGTLQGENAGLKSEVQRLMGLLRDLSHQAQERGIDMGTLPQLPGQMAAPEAGPSGSQAGSAAPLTLPPHADPSLGGMDAQGYFSSAQAQSFQQQPYAYPHPPPGGYPQQASIQSAYGDVGPSGAGGGPYNYPRPPPPPPPPSQPPQRPPSAQRPQHQPVQLSYDTDQEPHHADSYFPAFRPAAPPNPATGAGRSQSPEHATGTGALARKRKAADEDPASSPASSTTSSVLAMPPPGKMRRSVRTLSNLGAASPTVASSTGSSPRQTAIKEEEEEVKSLSPDTPTMPVVGAGALVPQGSVGSALAGQPIHVRRAMQDGEPSASNAAVQLSSTLPPLPSFPPSGSGSTPSALTPSFPLPTSLFSPSTLSSAGRYLSRPPPLSPFIDAHGMQSPFAMGLGHMPLGSAGVGGLNVSDIRTPSPGTSVGGGDGGYFWGSRN